MEHDYEIHVISNTHWDREWLNNFRETRAMLVEFFDRLLGILDREPRYHSYLLDSQAVPVEDYLEVRPEKRETVAAHVANRRLFIGPWYTCPEGFCVNGESLVRNLLYGHRVARAFGHVMKVGHTPFSYGQNSQMPQIYQNFGIDTILFYHGVSHEDTPNEFLFEGADGTTLFASQMSSGARYNFYHNVYRRVLYGSRIDDREYTWEQGGLPFHLCGEDHHMEHHILLDPPVAFHKECLEECIQELRKAEIKTATTKYLAFMDGHDSSLADTATLRIIDEAQQYIGNDKLFHSSLPDLMAKVKGAARNLQVLRGERRVPKPMGARVHLYSDVLSCRTSMKRMNAQAEMILQRQAEPRAAIAWCLGAEYPGLTIDTAWKLLLRAHAHDSIAGTGVDDIERDQIHRLRQVINISNSVSVRSLQHIQVRIDNADVDQKDVLVTVFNPSPYARSEVITAVVDVDPRSGYDSFSLEEPGCLDAIPIQIVSRKPYHAVVNHAGDATAMMTCDRVTFHFQTNEIPAMGYATYHLVRTPAVSRGGLVCGHNAMENEHLWLRINPDGTLDVRHKETGAHFNGLHYFEDGGEAGHAWMHIEPAIDSVLSSKGCPVRISLEENGPLLARYRVEHRLPVPARLDENGGDPWKRLDGAENGSKRSGETRDLIITSWITLRSGARAVDVVTRFENVCDSHRLRVLFPSGIKAKHCHVESAFDVVERDIDHASRRSGILAASTGDGWDEALSPTFPMQRFVDVSNGRTGLAIINDGLREYEVIPDEERTIAVTLLRAFEVALTTVSKRWEHHPEMRLSQCPGEHEFRYSIYPHAGDWAAAGVFSEAERLTVPLEPAQTGRHGGDLPKRHSFLAVEPAGLILSALKRSEDNDGLVVRVFNPTSAAIEGSITLFRKLASAQILSAEELVEGTIPVQDKTVQVKVPPKKIVTVKLRMERV